MRRWSWALGLSIALAAPPLMADGPLVGTIDGRIVDAQGKPLPGVIVTIASDRGEQSTTSDDAGEYRFSLLQPATYAISAKLEGMGSKESTVELTTGQRQTVDFQLGSTAESIVVSAEAPLVDRYQVGAAASLDADVADHLSFKARNYQASIEALPGIVQDAASRFQADMAFAMNGSQTGETAGFVDGVDTSFMRNGGSPRALLPSTSLEEVSLEDAGFGVEYGRVAGGVTNAVIKSGTNVYHGQFLYIPQNQEWRAPFDFANIPRDNNIIDSYETNLGGPIVRDKVWFFASYADQNTNQTDLTADGSVEDVSFFGKTTVGKVNIQPGERHRFTLLYVDSPIEKNHANALSGDRYALCACDLPGHLFTGSWAFTINSASFLELKGASQQNAINAGTIRTHAIDPSASPDSPNGNNFSYQDRGAGNIRYNAIQNPNGVGYVKIPRDQGNAALSWYAGRHELKFGADYQDIEQEELNVVDHRYNGLGFDRNLPGGFRTPQFLDVFVPAGAIQTMSGEILSGYAQDRMTLGKWLLNLGLRYDSQQQSNDVGVQTVDWGEVAPRAAVSYDVRDDGTLLIRATAGRYYQIHPNDFTARLFDSQPNGVNLFDRYNWNPVTRRYDIFQRRFTPAVPAALHLIDPYYKDEVTLGLAWQFSKLWAFEATGITWDLSDLYMSTSQFDANGAVVLDVRTWDSQPYQAERKYDGVRLILRRAFANSWTTTANYTWSNGRGNNFGAMDNAVTFDDDLFEGLGGVQVGTGATNATTVNRFGHGFFDRTHNLNIVGVKQFALGSHHDISLGGYFGFRSGEKWGLRPPTSVAHPVSRQSIATTTYTEPRDAEQLHDTYNLNLTGQWTFPIHHSIRGQLGLEAVNVTDQQEVIGINRANGQPIPGVAAYQIPREYRLEVGVTF